MVELIATAVTLNAGTRAIVADASLGVAPGEMVAIIGPNGAGKSSLVQALAAYRRPDRGSVSIDGRDIFALPARHRARLVTWLPQLLPLAWPVRLEDAVSMGRYAHGGIPRSLAPADRAAVDAAIVSCDLAHLAGRTVDSLSGGELARVHIARTIAVGAPLILADEPVAALDPAHRLAVMELFRAQTRQGKAVVVVLHDLALAARYADRIIGMRDGRIIASGSPQQVVTPAGIAALFDVEVRIDASDGWPSPMIVGPL